MTRRTRIMFHWVYIAKNISIYITAIRNMDSVSENSTKSDSHQSRQHISAENMYTDYVVVVDMAVVYCCFSC